MENERLAKVEEQLKWMAPRVERIEIKLDALLESHTFFKGKMIGICVVISAVIGIGIEIARAMF